MSTSANGSGGDNTAPITGNEIGNRLAAEDYVFSPT